MPELKNTFLEGKMNKDLDARLLKNGEYVDAQNIYITKSEGSDVGTVQNILGNTLPYSSNINKGTVIGYYADSERTNNNKYRIFYFVKGTGSYADNIYYYEAGSTTAPISLIDNTSNFLKFNTDYLITGINLIDNLLFWTDNLNQPRRINILTALGNTSYYNNEDKISVAKYYPFTPPQVLTQQGSTYYTGMQKAKTTAETTTSVTADTDIILTGYNNDIHQGQTIYESGTAIGVVESVSSDGLTVTVDQNITIVYDGVNPVELTFLNQNERLEEKFVRFAYRFKYLDGEYSLISPFTQHCFIPKTYNANYTDSAGTSYNAGGITGSQEELAAKTTELESFLNDVAHVRLQIELPSANPTTDFEIDKIEILYKESDKPSLKAIAQLSVTDASVGSDKIYNYTYKGNLPYKTLPEAQVTRVYDNVPAKAKAQEIIGNRIVYGNYQENPNNKPYSSYSFDYEVFLEDRGSMEPGEKYHIQYPYHTIKTRRTYQVGIVLADRYGRQSPVFLSDNVDNSLVKVNAKNTNEVSNSWNGEILKIKFNQPIPDSDANAASVLYDPNNPTANPTGWYSYKIVVKQTEQDYYNVYAPEAKANIPNADTLASYLGLYYSNQDKRTWLVLHGDNINKVPRDTTEESVDDNSVFPTNVSLYPKVNSHLTYIMDDGPLIDITSIGKALDHGLELINPAYTGIEQKTGNTYLQFHNWRKNPLLAELPDGYGRTINVTQSSQQPLIFQGTLGFSVWETKPFESALDIYYETLTCGLISDLENEINNGFGGGGSPTGQIPTTIQFNDSTTSASFDEGLTAPNQVGTNLQTLDQNGTAIPSGLTYSIVSVLEDGATPPLQEASETHFGIHDAGNNIYQLRITNPEFYYGASGHTYTVRIKVLDDQNNPARYQDFSITLNNSTPTLVLPATANHIHFRSTGTIFTPSSTTSNGSADPDQNNIFTGTSAYAITGVTYDPGGNDEDSSGTQVSKFTVNGSTGAVSANNHNFPSSEVGKVYRITMTVTDDGGLTSASASCDITIGGWFFGNYLYGAFTDICGVINSNSPSQDFYFKRPTSNTSTSLTPQYNDEVYTDAALTTPFLSGAIIVQLVGGSDGSGLHVAVLGGKVAGVDQDNLCAGYTGP
jgi:hypothetical protein